MHCSFAWAARIEQRFGKQKLPRNGRALSRAERFPPMHRGASLAPTTLALLAPLPPLDDIKGHACSSRKKGLLYLLLSPSSFFGLVAWDPLFQEERKRRGCSISAREIDVVRGKTPYESSGARDSQVQASTPRQKGLIRSITSFSPDLGPRG